MVLRTARTSTSKDPESSQIFHLSSSDFDYIFTPQRTAGRFERIEGNTPGNTEACLSSHSILLEVVGTPTTSLRFVGQSGKEVKPTFGVLHYKSLCLSRIGTIRATRIPALQLKSSR